jgi:hypothetical protein
MKAGFNTVSDPDWIRTNDLLLRRQLLYPTELPDLIFNVLPQISSGERKNSFFIGNFPCGGQTFSQT